MTFLSLEECRFFVTINSKKEGIFFESDSVRLIYISIVYCSL